MTAFEVNKQPLLCPAVKDLRKGYRRSVCGVDSVYYRIEGERVEMIGQQGIERRFF